MPLTLILHPKQYFDHPHLMESEAAAWDVVTIQDENYTPHGRNWLRVMVYDWDANLSFGRGVPWKDAPKGYGTLPPLPEPEDYRGLVPTLLVRMRKARAAGKDDARGGMGQIQAQTMAWRDRPLSRPQPLPVGATLELQGLA